jgi:hypothetical protein
MRPSLASAILALAAGTYKAPIADIERELWRETERFFTALYADEREYAEWFDLGGEG